MSAFYSIGRVVIKITTAMLVAAIITIPKLYSQTHLHQPHIVLTNLTSSVVVFEDVNFGGTSTTLAAGKSGLTGKVSSVKVPQGFVVLLYEFADQGGGYGRSIDLMEDCPDVTKYLGSNVSYADVFSSKNSQGFIWVRNKMENGQFVSGHWERERASGQNLNSSEPVVSPPLPAHVSNTPTVLEVNDAVTNIKSLGLQQTGETLIWEHAINDQMGIIGSDFRGSEEIGSAAFEREFKGGIEGKILDAFGASNINFWYPQKQPNDHRSIVYFKRTLSGKLNEVHQAGIDDILPDHDLNIIIEPSEKYRYLMTDGHSPELTTITKIGLVNSGEAVECPDNFTEIEAEIDSRNEAKDQLEELLKGRLDKTVCVYGPWIYDKGHCCQPEIHPAEEVWWSENNPGGNKYYFSVICDGSQRYWWKDQMDDGTKLKPWGAPPIVGRFAIAFEKKINQITVPSTLKYDVKNIKDYNVIEYPNADKSYDLVYQGKTIVSFSPHNNAFKISYENVGLAPGKSDVIRGFIVIETSVGTCTQVATEGTVINGTSVTKVNVPEGTDPVQVDQRVERQVFKKVDGYYLFSVTQTESGLVSTMSTGN